MAEITQSPSSPEDTFTSRKVLRHRLEQIGWVVVGLMLVVGVGSTINRMVFMAHAMAEPGSAYNAFDIRYVELPWASWLHLLPALLIALTGPTQFMRQVRKRYRGWHRLAGRIYLIAGLIGAVTGFVIGGLNPFMGLDGPGFNEAMATLVFSSLVIWVLLSAYSAARRRNFALHREWMVRSWALMMAIATERILLGIFSATTDVSMAVLFGTTFWMAGAINMTAAEVWINLTRTPGKGQVHWKDLDARS